MSGVDMLHGPLLLKILWFSLPLAASSLLEQLFNSVDIAVVGHFVGSNALAAVGSNAPVIGLLINLFMGISMGANAVISTLIGQRDHTRIRHAVSTVAVVALVSGFALMVLGTSLARPILSAMSTPPEVLDMAILYLRIYFLGMPFFMVYVFGAAILRSKGDTRRPLYILFVAGIANTLLNLLFVLVFHMGVEGVAISTSIANALSAFLMVRLLRREEVPFRLDFHDLHVDRRELLRMLKIGVPAGLQGMVFSVSNVVVQSQINTFGADAVAGSSAALNFEYYCYFIIQAFNGAAISFIAQNYGAGLMQRVRRVFWICMVASVIFCGMMNGIFACFSPSSSASSPPQRPSSPMVSRACTSSWPSSGWPAATKFPLPPCAEWGVRSFPPSSRLSAPACSAWCGSSPSAPCGLASIGSCWSIRSPGC